MFPKDEGRELSTMTDRELAEDLHDHVQQLQGWVRALVIISSIVIGCWLGSIIGRLLFPFIPQA